MGELGAKNSEDGGGLTHIINNFMQRFFSQYGFFTRTNPAAKDFYVCPSTNVLFTDLQSFLQSDDEGVSRIYSTIQAAHDAAVTERGDIIHLVPGSYDESIVITKNNLTIVGMGGRGSAYILPTAAGAEGVQVSSNDVTFMNIGVAGDDTGDYALNLHAAKRFRAVNCRFELASGAGSAILIDGVTATQTSDAIFLDCEIVKAAKGFTFDDSVAGYPTRIIIKGCYFSSITTNMLGIATGGLVKNLELIDCVFDNAEDGTAPTDYILLSDNTNTGIISGNRFATATNATGVLTIGTGLKWATNATEAGWSTARPA